MNKIKYWLLVVTLLLTACGNAGDGGQDTNPVTVTPSIDRTVERTQITTIQITPTPEVVKGTLTIWHSWNEEQVAILEEILDEFQQEYPEVLFDVLYIPQENLLSRLDLAVLEGGGPDLFYGPAEWGPGLYRVGLISDLSNLINNQILEQINPPALDGARYQNDLLGLPYAQQGVVLYRNVSLAPDIPATFDDLVRMANGITQGEIVGAYLDQGFFFSGGHLDGLGGRLMDEDGLPAFNNNQGLTWLELLQDFSQAGATDYASDKDLQLFQEGRVGWIIDGTWNREVLLSALGQDNVAIDPWPAYKGQTLSGYVQSWNVYLSAQTSQADQKIALDFMEFLLSTNQQAKLVDGGFIPVVSGLRLADPRQERILSQIIAALAGGTAYPIAPEMTVYLAPMDLALQSVLFRDVPPEQALAEAEEAILREIERARSTPTSAP